MEYIELHARSAFSFLRGASMPEHLAEAAAHWQMPAMAVCDRDGVYGAPRFFAAAREQKIRPIIGAELTLEDGAILPVLVESQEGYRNLCRLLTRAHLRSEKGHCAVRWDELPEFAPGLVALTGDAEGPLVTAVSRALWPATKTTASKTMPRQILDRLVHAFGRKNVFVEIQRHHLQGEDRMVRALVELAEQTGLSLLATNGVLQATPAGRQVLDVFTCIRNHIHLDAAGKLLARNSERHLKDAAQMRLLFRDLPAAIENTARLAEQLQFTLDDLGYEFPRYPVGPGESMDSVLRAQTYAGASLRYDHKIPEDVRRQLDRELVLIGKLGFAGYFLIVADIVKFCRDNNIMAQGRGSAANSAVCYCLRITAVDAVKSKLLFERFLSEGRKSWPDIDIDLPSGDRRESVIQEIYRRYGRHGAAMTANVITYRGRSAAREIGKALNVAPDVLDRFSNLFAHGDFPHTLDLTAQMEEAGLPARHPRAAAFVTLYQQIHSLPRHLGQHSGGMIICQGKLDAVVPLENASMPGRVVAQWDKDDCSDMGIIKVDLLGLGMMSVLQDAIELTRRRGHPVDLARIPQDDGPTFEMMRQADTIGVFQIESRAQMATLPRLKPKEFYDVVIQVAIIRPGPIQGKLMHPYLRRRSGKEPVTFYHESLEPLLQPILGRTLGVPLFQEQMLAMAMALAGFSGSEAEELRRALSFHRSPEKMQRVEKKLRHAMVRRDYPMKVIDDVSNAISAFALYGFPESHAISFALLAYASAYLKLHYAPEFYTGLLNNQPMGFYSPATIVKDARRHGIKIRHVCAAQSEWLCHIEQDDSVRLGFCMVQNVRQEHALEMLRERQRKPYESLPDFKQRTMFNKEELRSLAEIGALNCLAAHRRDALWEIERELVQDDLFFTPVLAASNRGTRFRPGQTEDAACPLSPMTMAERLRADFNGTQLTLGPHPMALLRARLPDVWRASDLGQAQNGATVRIGGNVICRQRPGTAKGFVFISLEDETGVSNAIVSPPLFEKLRLVITEESFLVIEGKLQNVDNVILIQARHIERLQHELLGSASYDFH